MEHAWFRSRRYRHFDVPVGVSFADIQASSASFVEKHCWLPLIHYVKREKRYKPVESKTSFKDRDIMYASHRDACILARYGYLLTNSLEKFYNDSNLIIAYRKLGKANYDFASDAYQFCLASAPCIVLCFDISGFYDNLDHQILKQRLKRVLTVSELSADWHKVYKYVTNFSAIERIDLQSHPVFGPRMKARVRSPIATIAQVKSAGIPIHSNQNVYGIPQGTPISSTLSNVYMIDLDLTMAAACSRYSSFYRRYSDDILIICQPQDESAIVDTLLTGVSRHKLELKTAKTKRQEFGVTNPNPFQYLGFYIDVRGATIRSPSLARQWRKTKRSIRRVARGGQAAIAAGKSSSIYTKELRRRFSPVGSKNFSSYARKAGEVLGSKRIVKQALRLERKVDRAIADLKAVTLPRT